MILQTGFFYFRISKLYSRLLQDNIRQLRIYIVKLRMPPSPTPPPNFHVVFGVLEEIGKIIGVLMPRIGAPIPLEHTVSDAVRS